jgi:hypothetical protein
MQFLDVLEKLTEDEVQARYTPEALVAGGIGINSINQTTHKDIYASELNEDTDKFVNGIKFMDQDLNLRPLPLKTNAGKVTGDMAKARFTSILGIGEVVQIPLHHSGIWIAISPPKDNELINLENALSSNQILLGRLTSTLVYSNYSVVFNRILVDFILDHMVATSLKLTEEDDIRNYILIQDLYPLVLGLITSMYPDGYNITRSCANTIVEDENGVPVCTFVSTAKVDPKKLLWLNRTSLNKEMMMHMSKRTPGSVTVEDVKYYQSTINKLADQEIIVTATNGTIINITLTSPTLFDYITNGELWVQNVIKKAEDIFVTTDTAEIKNGKVSDVLSAVLLGIYNVYVKRIESDGAEVDDRYSIDEILDTISSDEKILDEFIEKVRAYINGAVIAIVATPDFVCPNCRSNQPTHELKAFKDLVPLNVVENFFALSALRINKIRNRNITS